MKKCFFGFIIILFLFGCKENNTKNINGISIASPITNQIQHIDEFRLDKIVLDVRYDDENSQHIVLYKDILMDFEVKVGYQELELKDSELIIPILIYDDDFIKNNYIYYYDNVITYGKNIYEITPPTKADFYFYGWFTNESCSIRYYDDSVRIVEVFPGFSIYETYKVDFYLDDKIIERQYILSGARPEKLDIEENELFYCWTPTINNIFEDTKYEAVMLEDNEHLVEFYDDDKFIGYKVVKHGEDVMIDDPVKDNYIFKGWDQELTNVTEDLKVYAKFYKEQLTVNFYSVEGELLETDLVYYGESASFDSKKDGYNYVGFSHSLDNIYTDLDVTVYMTKKVCTYYVDGMVYAIKYYEEKVEVPYKYYHTGYWVEFEEGKFRAEYEPNGQKFIFYFIEENTSYVLYEKEAMSVNWYIYFYEMYGYIYEFYNQNGNVIIYKPNSLNYSTPEVQINCYKKDIVNSIYYESIYSSGGFIYNETFDCYEADGSSWEGITYLKGGYDAYYERVINTVSSNIFNNYDLIILGKDIIQIVDTIPYYKRAQYIIVEDGNPKYYSLNGDLYDKDTGECIYSGGDQL